MRLIDGDALEELFRETIGHIAKRPEIDGSLEHLIRASAMAVEMIKDAKTVDPFVSGEWEEPEPEGTWVFDKRMYSQCSVCKKKSYFGWSNNFCRNCGAKMEPTEVKIDEID
jgi:hypothetical protein